MTAHLTERLRCPDRKALDDSHDSAKIAMRLLIRSANLDRRLLSDRDWQQSMTFLNAMINKQGKDQ